MGRFGKKMSLKTSALFYNVFMLGTQKAGKTSTIKAVCEKLGGDESYILCELAGENGADAIEGAVYENLYEWSELEDMVEDIVDNKTSDYPDLKVLVMDTFSGLIELAEKEAIRIWNKKNPDKKGETINAVWGSFGRGEKYAMKLIDELLIKIQSVGVKVWFVGHVKQKEITDAISGDTYSILTSDEQNNYFGHYKKMFDIICLLYLDREMIKEKEKDKFTGKIREVGKITGETRKIRFRDGSYVSDTGSRFAHITEEIIATPDNFIQAIEDAIKKEIESKGGDISKRIKEDELKKKEFEKELAEKENENKKRKEVADIINPIIDYIKERMAEKDKESVTPIMAKCKELGYTNPLGIIEAQNLEDARALYKVYEGEAKF